MAVNLNLTGALTLGTALTVGNGGSGVTAASQGTGGVALAVNGTFVPTVAFGGASTGITYTTQTGHYTRVGDTVVFSVNIVLSNKGSSTGAATIQTLPFTSRTGPVNQAIGLGSENLTFANSEVPKARIASAATTITLVSSKSNSASTVIVDTDFANTTAIEITGVYLI